MTTIKAPLTKPSLGCAAIPHFISWTRMGRAKRHLRHMYSLYWLWVAGHTAIGANAEHEFQVCRRLEPGLLSLSSRLSPE